VGVDDAELELHCALLLKVIHMVPLDCSTTWSVLLSHHIKHQAVFPELSLASIFIEIVVSVEILLGSISKDMHAVWGH
jgi:hypothetical protein